MLVANDEYPDSCTDTADIGSYGSTIAGVVSMRRYAIRAYPSAYRCADGSTDYPPLRCRHALLLG